MDQQEKYDEFNSSKPVSVIRRHSGMSEEQLEELRIVFQLFDRNGDGKITKDELGRVMRSLGQFPTACELHQMILEADVDGDGSVSFDDFIDLSCTTASDESLNVSLENEAEELKDAFKVFDKHNRGYITSSDLSMVLQCLGEDLPEEEIEDMIDEVDVSGDRIIGFNEFVRAMGDPSDGHFFFENTEG